MRVRAQAATAICFTLLLVAACTSPRSSSLEAGGLDYQARRALESEYRRAERKVLDNYENPVQDDMDALVETLRRLDRDSEAAAFTDFVERYSRGESTYDLSKSPRNEDCKGHLPHERLIRRWKKIGDLPERVPFSLANTAANFKIGTDGRIYDIDVFVAKHPGAAWLIIDYVGGALVSQKKLKRVRKDSPNDFPIELCLWVTKRGPGELTPDGFSVRGSGI
jgi:hypothetical protein